jgi:hypothetical protein
MNQRHENLILPKGYLSWSQKDCWDGNPARYAKEYFDDGPRLDTMYLRFGGQFSRMVEDLEQIMKSTPDRYMAIQALRRDHLFDDNMESVLMELDIEGISEYQIGNSGRKDDTSSRVLVRGQVPILAYLDKYVTRNGAIQEYKTGIAPWTLAKVQKHDQLPFYGVGLKWSGHALPEYADLHWIETIVEEEERKDFWRDGAKIIRATGRIKTFHREFDEREFDRMEESIIKTAWEISDAYQDHLAQL